jgi:transcription elongation factor GreA
VKKTPITMRGEKKLRTELQKLKSDDRPRVVKAIAEARAHGDLRENAEYHAAKEEQGLMEARIKDIEAKLYHAEIIDVTSFGSTGRVIFGATVGLVDEDDGSEVTYTIVGDDEAHIGSGLISISSPIARALIGKQEGDLAVVDAPAGERSYEIVEVKYQ